MKLTFVLLTLCIASTMAVQKEGFLSLNVNPYAQDVLAQLKGSKLGSAISTLVELKMKLGQDYDYEELFDAFDELRKWLNDQRTQAASAMGQRTTQNTNLLAEWTITFNDNTGQVTSGNAQLFQLNAYLTQETTSLNANNANLANLGSLLTTLHTTRTTNNNNYNDQRPRIVAAIDGCNAALTCLENLDDGSDASFIQVQESNKNFRTHIQSAANELGKIDNYNKEQIMLNSLLSMSQEYTDQSSLDNVVALVTDLRAQLVARLANIDATETQEVESYTTRVGELDGQVSGLEAENEGHSGNIFTTAGTIDTTQTAVDNAQGRADTIQSNMDNEARNYSEYITAFNDKNTRIDAELAILDSAENALSLGGIHRDF